MEPKFVQTDDSTVALVRGGIVSKETIRLAHANLHFGAVALKATRSLCEAMIDSSGSAFAHAVTDASELQAMLNDIDGEGPSLFEDYVSDNTIQRARDIVRMVVEHVNDSGRVYPGTGLPLGDKQAA